ncbi:SAM-dependent methyltransferase [Paenibacillus crassostreae]|uniref:SAM-dependent methyltransferase n=1 Tax=Paenibacillus crassostreae TaxID=1763538 RepID=A0A167FTN1_9BACL|nr:SAM-dependent methyltransferase [Paenibacillus crassostreae]AOZ94075.1 SAM-dependent methyltransferase [Paenibacillus crassostreae]OAB76889.1 SAM-dependent methyltransferase [Paenibacillus crassostreae]
MNLDEQNGKLDLDRVVFIGRSFEEYMKIFSLSLEEVQGKKILDCPSGACSFTAIANQLGVDVTACDLAYYHEAENLRHKGIEDIEHAMEHVESVKDNYVRDYFEDIEALKLERLNALNHCYGDMIKFTNRYVPVVLPVLPFKDEEFDLILSAHLLFTYADRLNYNFHESTINELLRVSKEELRIFPLVDVEGKRYVHLDEIKKYLQGKGYTTEEVEVPYEFQRNANSMLIVKKGK